MARSQILPVVAFLLLGCAQVPQESVELSATVGRDLATVHQAHRALAQLLFTRMRHDVNRFVDEVYAPFQIRRVIEHQNALANSSNPDDRRKALFLAITAATKPDAPAALQNGVITGMGLLMSGLRADIESMRQELLDPLDAQETQVIGSIDRSYQQIHYANSIVTGHLSSIVKVHDAQAEVLQAIGVDRDLRREVGENLAFASDKIGSLVESAQKVDTSLAMVEGSAGELRLAVDSLRLRLGAGRKED
jgi:hypothetical protein